MLGLDTITTTIQQAIDSLKPPVPKIPSILLWCTMIKRPGMSTAHACAKILAKNEVCGIPTGENKDGSPNLYNQLSFNIVSSILDELKDNGVIQSTIEPGGLNVTGTGSNAGGPFVVNSTNVDYPTILGKIF